ncbi:hypothetical protein [Myxococcus eversor]|uniref:hypothetical protein n=1 Tax=Myxococcus eversor TaxID=2709661 RepID=UPI0013D0D7B5|nr:hypothetical protein [Myxococcus eversor]
MWRFPAMHVEARFTTRARPEAVLEQLVEWVDPRQSLTLLGRDGRTARPYLGTQGSNSMRLERKQQGDHFLSSLWIQASSELTPVSEREFRAVTTLTPAASGALGLVLVSVPVLAILGFVVALVTRGGTMLLLVLLSPAFASLWRFLAGQCVTREHETLQRAWAHADEVSQTS